MVLVLVDERGNVVGVVSAKLSAVAALKTSGALPENVPVQADDSVDLIALDRALQRLEQLDPQQSRVVELRFFGGLSVVETAQALHVSPATVKREWATARAWLLRELGRGAQR